MRDQYVFSAWSFVSGCKLVLAHKKKVFGISFCTLKNCLQAVLISFVIAKRVLGDASIFFMHEILSQRNFCPGFEEIFESTVTFPRSQGAKSCRFGLPLTSNEDDFEHNMI